MYESKSDVEKFRSALELWYNETMDRCTGWYTKQARLIVFCVGFILAIAFNLDTVALVRILSNNPEARRQLATLAEKNYQQYDPKGNLVNTNSAITKEAYSKITESIKEARAVVGLGWDDCEFNATYQPNCFHMLAGWFVTALAISLGAPFWFDVLNKVMLLRAGKKAEDEPLAQPSISPSTRVG